MIERIGFKNQIDTLRTRLIGKSALMIDDELRLAYRGSLVDVVTEQNLHPEYVPLYEGMYADHDQQENFLDNGWEPQDEYDRMRDRWIKRAVPSPIIVDEYGHETCFEPTTQQIERLASQTGEYAITLEQRIKLDNFRLASEGMQAIKAAEFRDERAIQELFEKDGKGLGARSRLASLIHLTVSESYNADANQTVVIDSRKAYAAQQKVINQTMNHSAETIQ